jgi:hypothetical protein
MRRRMNSTEIRRGERTEDRGERREERGGRTRCAVAIALKASSIRLFDDCFHTYGSPPDFACKPEQTPPVRHHAIRMVWFWRQRTQARVPERQPRPEAAAPDRLAPAWHGIALPDLDIVTWSLHVAAAVADLIGAGVSRERRIDPRSREVDGLQSQTRVACASHCARRREPRASLAPNANA